jgi:hypothetical protein
MSPHRAFSEEGVERAVVAYPGSANSTPGEAASVPDRNPPTGSCPQAAPIAEVPSEGTQPPRAGSADDVAVRVARECTEQGIPVAIDDPVTIAKIITLVRAGHASTSATRAAKSARRGRPSGSARGRSQHPG